VAHELKQYADARRLHQESLTLKQAIGDQRGAIHSYVHLGQAAVELGDYRQARQEFAIALKNALEMKALPLALEAVEGLAQVCAKESQFKQAAELLALVLAHPASEQRTRERASVLMARVAQPLDPQQLSLAQAHGIHDTGTSITNAGNVIAVAGVKATLTLAWFQRLQFPYKRFRQHTRHECVEFLLRLNLRRTDGVCSGLQAVPCSRQRN